MRILIIEDEENSRELIKIMLKRIDSQIEVVGECPSVSEGIDLIQEVKPDVLFLDIELEDGSGFDILNSIPKPFFKTIFITSYNHYGVEAIKHAALDYILKPISFNELQGAVEKAKKSLNADKSNQEALAKVGVVQDSQHILISDGANYKVCIPEQLIYIKADHHYSNIHFSDGSNILSSESLNIWEQKLPEMFFRIHKSCIVNLNYVRTFSKQDNELELPDKTKLKVASRRVSEFMKLLKNLHA